MSIFRREPQPLPYYRSRVTRAAFILTGLYLAWSFLFGPDIWRNTPSLHWLYDHWLPAPLIAGLFLAYVVLMVIGQLVTMQIGCCIGLVLYGWELAGLLFTLSLHRPTNPLAIAACVLSIVLHYACLRLIVIQWDSEQRDGRSA